MKEFSHRDVGKSEAVWLACVARLPSVEVGALGPVSVIAPHPDDEVLAGGGLLQLLARDGVPVQVVSLTDGEAADPTRGGLGEARQRELRAALDRLGLHATPVVRLRLPDGQLAGLLVQDLAAAIGAAVDPSALLIAPLPGDGHPDHDAAGLAAAQLARCSGAQLWQYAIWAWHWAAPGDMPFGRGLRVDFDAAVWARKRSAVDAFVSQTSGPDPVLSPAVRAHFERSCEVFFGEG